MDKSTFILIARKAAVNTKERHAYLPSNAYEGIEFRPHAWVVEAIEKAYQLGVAAGTESRFGGPVMKPTREQARARYTNREFNEWLDTPTSTANGLTVFDAIGDIGSAYTAWLSARHPHAVALSQSEERVPDGEWADALLDLNQCVIKLKRHANASLSLLVADCVDALHRLRAAVPAALQSARSGQDGGDAGGEMKRHEAATARQPTLKAAHGAPYGRVDCGECPNVTSGCEAGKCAKAVYP